MRCHLEPPLNLGLPTTRVNLQIQTRMAFQTRRCQTRAIVRTLGIVRIAHRAPASTNCYEPCQRSVDDFRKKRNITAPIVKIDWTGVYWRKPAA